MTIYPSQEKAIVEKIINKLQVNNITDADPKNFFKNPFRETDDDELPCVKVAIMDAPAEWFTNKIEYKNTFNLAVVYVDNGNDDLEDKLYYMKDRLRDFLINDENTTQLDGLVDELVFQGYEMNFQNAEIGLGAVALKFQGVYYSEHIASTDTFEKLNVKIYPKEVPDTEPPTFEETITLPTD